MYDHYFSNFGRPTVPDDLCKDSAQRHPLFWKRRFLKADMGMAAILVNHFSNLSYPQPKEAPYEI